MSLPIRVLHVVGSMNMGGLENRTMDIYRAIDRDKVQFDFLQFTDRPAHFDGEIKALGGVIYYAAPGLKRLKERSAQVKRILQEHPYDIVHLHVGALTATTIMTLRRLRAQKTARIYVQSHNSSAPSFFGRVKHRLFRPWMRYMSADWSAVSHLAGVWMFGKSAMRRGRVEVIHDAFPIGRYSYNERTRLEARNELGLGNCLVVGHVGRFDLEKNHLFLLDIFAQVQLLRADAKLLLVGGGMLMERIRARADELGIAQDVIFAGIRTDTDRLYLAMDVFCFPSLFEGLPGTPLEAQAAGLPCFLADTITREVDVLPQTEFLSLTLPAEEWAKRIITAESPDRMAATDALRREGFDAKEISEKWLGIYLDSVCGLQN